MLKTLSVEELINMTVFLAELQRWATYGAPRSDWRDRAARRQDGSFDVAASGIAAELAQAALAHDTLVDAAEACANQTDIIVKRNITQTNRGDALKVAIARAREHLERVRSGILPRIRSLAASEAPDIPNRGKADLRAAAAELEYTATRVESGLNDFTRTPGLRLSDGRRLGEDGTIT